MGDEGALLGPNAVRDLQAMRRVFKRQPNAGKPRNRRVKWDDLTSSPDGGGNTTGPCGCCNCVDCVNLCNEATDADVISDCTTCTNALSRYKFNPGAWAAFPGLVGGGEIDLDWVSGCIWESDHATDSGGTYKWRLTQIFNLTKVELVHVSGSDPTDITNGWRRVKWVSVVTTRNAWSCLCNMAMKLDAPDRVKLPAGLNCQICLVPVVKSQYPSGNCTPVEGVNPPCVEDIEFPGVTFPQFADPTKFPYGFDGETAVTIAMGFFPIEGITCAMRGGADLGGTVNTPGALSATLAYSVGELDFNMQLGLGASLAHYEMDPDDLVLGANVFTLISSSDASLTVWPATITVTLSDCTFGSTHEDVGYGCGGEGVDCSGAGSSSWEAVDDPESPTGFSWGIDTTTCTGSCRHPTVDEMTDAYGYPEVGETLTDIPCVPI